MTIGFLLKKLLSAFVQLVPGVLFLLLLTLLCQRRLPRFSVLFSLLLTVLLIVVSVPRVGTYFVAQLEDKNPVMQQLPDDTGLVLVLGYAHSYRADKPPNSILSPVALSRLIEGVRLWKTKPSVTLVVSGAPPVAGAGSHAQMMENMAIELGVPQNKIVRFDDSVDTEAEIVAAATLLKKSADTDAERPLKRLVVVSSAIHLPRAGLMLRKQDVPHALAPAEFIVTGSVGYMPSPNGLRAMDRVLHEWVGMLWYRLKPV